MHQFLRMILICGAFLGCVMIAFGKADRLVDAFTATSCVCSSSGSDSPDSEPIKICCDGQDSSLLVLGFLIAPDAIVHVTVLLGVVGFEHSVLPEGPYLEKVEPPLI